MTGRKKTASLTGADSAFFGVIKLLERRIARSDPACQNPPTIYKGGNMEYLSTILVIGFFVWFFLLRDEDGGTKKTAEPARQPETTSITPEISVSDDCNSPEVVIIRQEIKDALAKHAAAASALQALARIDGTTSETERNIVFDFMNRIGCGFSEKHRQWFYGSRSGEWFQSADDHTINQIIKGISAEPLKTRIEIYASALAIVSSGGKPKKREAELLEKIREVAFL